MKSARAFDTEIASSVNTIAPLIIVRGSSPSFQGELQCLYKPVRECDCVFKSTGCHVLTVSYVAPSDY